MLQRAFSTGIALLLLPLFVAMAVAQPTMPVDSLEHSEVPGFALLRDTIYVLDSVFLEVRLDKQVIYQHFRDGRVKEYLCSTGNPRIKDGIATREGIFSLQWKSKRYMSRQFQVWLNYWMPFDGGIGFHGLDGRSYYRYLGKRPSSHGCVRISNETGKQLFSSSPNGSTVYVHSGAPARILQFADTADDNLTLITTEHHDLLAQRLDAVHNRLMHDSSLIERLTLPPGKEKRALGKIYVGKAKGLAPVQYPIEPVRIPLIAEAPRLLEAPASPERARFLNVPFTDGESDADTQPL